MRLEMGSRMTHIVYLVSMNYIPYKIIILEQIMQFCSGWNNFHKFVMDNFLFHAIFAWLKCAIEGGKPGGGFLYCMQVMLHCSIRFPD